MSKIKLPQFYDLLPEKTMAGKEKKEKKSKTVPNPAQMEPLEAVKVGVNVGLLCKRTQFFLLASV